MLYLFTYSNVLTEILFVHCLEVFFNLDHVDLRARHTDSHQRIVVCSQSLHTLV